MDSFEPQPFQVVADSRQLKAFSDPLRVRIVNLLGQRAATNQQLADELAEPQAKVLYHVRFLLDAGLIRLVDQRVRGGNVEKYYRATARLFGLRPGSDAFAGLAGVALEAVLQEVVASETAWPEQDLEWETRRGRLSPERDREFRRRLRELLLEYWGGPDPNASDDPAQARAAPEDPTAPRLCLAAVIYREPLATDGGAS